MNTQRIGNLSPVGYVWQKFDISAWAQIEANVASKLIRLGRGVVFPSLSVESKEEKFPFTIISSSDLGFSEEVPWPLIFERAKDMGACLLSPEEAFLFLGNDVRPLLSGTCIFATESFMHEGFASFHATHTGDQRVLFMPITANPEIPWKHTVRWVFRL